MLISQISMLGNSLITNHIFSEMHYCTACRLGNKVEILPLIEVGEFLEILHYD